MEKEKERRYNLYNNFFDPRFVWKDTNKFYATRYILKTKNENRFSIF